ncbi:MAG: hypothetical protein FGF53_09025, partial [Candidatus Brockarchaeota archaeon]|nr:hypothetical protein [Candidatus Brockarchaeota archaeon]
RLEDLKGEASKVHADQQSLRREDWKPWEQLLQEQLKARLPPTDNFGASIIQGLARQIRTDIEKQGMASDFLQEFSVRLKDGDLFRFSARLKGAKNPQITAVLSSMPLGNEHLLQYERISLWPQVKRPILIAASEPVPAKIVSS